MNTGNNITTTTIITITTIIIIITASNIQQLQSQATTAAPRSRRTSCGCPTARNTQPRMHPRHLIGHPHYVLGGSWLCNLHPVGMYVHIHKYIPHLFCNTYSRSLPSTSPAPTMPNSLTHSLTHSLTRHLPHVTGNDWPYPRGGRHRV